MPVKIAITDDHLMVLKGIQSMLSAEKEIEVVGLYENAQNTLDQIGESKPEVLLLDINLPDINGIDLCKQLLKLYPELKILALTNFEETSFVRRILNNGAHGYLLKNTSKPELLEALKAVLSGEQYLQKDIQRKLLNRSIGITKSRDLLQPKLTRREKEVLNAIADEMTTLQIAEKLFISPKTVESHRMNLISKLGVKNSVGLVKLAMERDLLG